MIEVEKIANGLTEAQRTAILSARLVESGGVRIPYTFAGSVMHSLDKAGLAVGMYLSLTGLAVRKHLESTK